MKSNGGDLPTYLNIEAYSVLVANFGFWSLQPLSSGDASRSTVHECRCKTNR